MGYVVYNTESTRIETEKRWGKDVYATEGAAKAARTRMLKKSKKVNGAVINYNPKDLAVAEITHYRNNIEKMVKKVNMMSGQEYYESVNTPNYCSPSSEAYWSM